MEGLHPRVHPSQQVAFNSALIACRLKEGPQYCQLEKTKSPHLCWEQTFKMATLRPPTFLPVIPHLCSVNKHNKLIGSPVMFGGIQFVFEMLGGQVDIV